MRPRGSAAGHNGMKSLIRSVGTQDFARLRLGIHPGHPVDGAKFVLAPFRRAQLADVRSFVEQARQAVESVIAEGAEKAMATYNRRAQGSNIEEA